jgi:phage shock protein E
MQGWSLLFKYKEIYMKKIIMLIILSSVFALSCFADEKPIAEIVIDVRTSSEYENGHIENAINIPYDVIKDRITEITDDKEALIKLYCKSGRRSGIAKNVLDKLGYRNVTNEGGYEEFMKMLEVNY